MINKIARCFIILIILIVFSGMSLMIYDGIEMDKKRECLVWKKWAGERRGYYLVPWQKEQCDVYGIEINAPVKGGD